MRRLFVLAALLFALPAQAVDVEWVTVGDPDNAADDRGYGSVAYTYLISKHEVTNAQYTAFLNAVAATDPHPWLWSTEMGYGYGGITRSGTAGSYTYSAIAGREHMPVIGVSFWDAVRFANWLHNGQPTGAQDNSTTEDGAYTITEEGITNNSITRKAGATIFIPTEAEWHKAAYYDAVSASYFSYPASSNSHIVCAAPSATPNTANCSREAPDWGLTTVGSYTGSASPSGTFDQGGNVWEWNESIIGAHRGLRGGSFTSYESHLGQWWQWNNVPRYEYYNVGFRVASVPAGWSPCDDGLDNDGDGLIDYPADPGCFEPLSDTEEPECQDGDDNDDDGRMDFDGGLSALGYLAALPDLACLYPWYASESGPDVVVPRSFVLADYEPLDPGNTWDYENTRNSVPQGISRTTVLEQTKNVGGAETRILEKSPDGSRIFLTNDAAGLRQHGFFAPGRGNEPDSTLTFAPPLALADAVVEIGDVLESTGSAIFKFRGIGIFTGSYTLRSTVLGIERISVPLRAERFDALRIEATLEISLAIPGGSSTKLSSTNTDWRGLGIGVLRSIEEVDGVSYEANLVATNVPVPSVLCDDGLDNDGDGLIDYPDDPGCADADDLAERSPDLVCDDGLDNDGDTYIDYPSDIGCVNPLFAIEDPECQDGGDNDDDGLIDFDGGVSAGVRPMWRTAPDPECVDPWQIREASCGLGVELALLLPPLMWLWRRRGWRV